MDNFFVIEISDGDERIAGKAIYGYQTEREAVATFHQRMATAMKSDLYDSELVLVIDKYGVILWQDRFL